LRTEAYISQYGKKTQARLENFDSSTGKGQLRVGDASVPVFSPIGIGWYFL